MTGFRFLIVGSKEDEKKVRRFFKDNNIKFEAANWIDCSKIESVIGFGLKLRSYWYYGDDELERRLMNMINGTKLF